MTQSATIGFSEGAVWMLLQFTGVAMIYLVVRCIVGKYRLSQSHHKGTSQKQNLPNPAEDLNTNGNENSHSNSAWASMGKVTPLHDFNYRTTEPMRIYKFKPKYFLTMGLQQTDIDGITHIDNLYAKRIQARQDIYHENSGALECLDSAVPMLNEFYEYLMQEYVSQRYPTIFRLDAFANTVENLVTNEKLPLTAPVDRYDTLRRINRNLEEDFLMLLPSPDGDGYSLQSYCWAYPVGFKPQDKKGIKLRDAHGPVPGYKEKLELSMDRYFAKLEPGNIKYRASWAVATNDALCVPGEYHLYPGQEPTETEVDLKNCYVRCELQTLFALPKSGGKILSVHLYLYPLQEIKDVGLGPQMAEAIDGLGSVPGMFRYKRGIIWAEQIKEFLMN